MHWSSVNEFLAMGGYALYVWGSYAVAAILLLAEVMLLRKQRRDTLKRIKRMHHRKTS
jgi:heme exporter protein D